METRGTESALGPWLNSLSVRLPVLRIIIFRLLLYQLYYSSPNQPISNTCIASCYRHNSLFNIESFDFSQGQQNCMGKHNIQMQYSKEAVDLLGKIERLKEQINQASEYTHLQKCSHRLGRLCERADALLQRRTRKQLREMCQVADGLIKLKTKKLKKRIIQQIARTSTKEDSPPHQKTVIGKEKPKEKTLAYSKSLDCFDLQPPIKVAPKPQEEDSWQDRTEVHPRNGNLRLERRVQQLQEELASYKRQLSKMEQGRSSATLTQLCLRLGQQQGLFEQQLGFKVREKVVEADQLREKLRRSEERNTELKNRLFNEQKRQDDYIQGLKSQLLTNGQQLQAATRQNRKLQEELNKMYFVCDGYKTEVRRLIEQTQQMRRQRSQIQQAELVRLKDNGLRRELEEMEQQERYMRQMQGLLEAEQDKNAVLNTQIEQLEKRNKILQAQSDDLMRKNQKLEELLEIKEEQTAQVKDELMKMEKDKKSCLTQLVEARQAILQLKTEIDCGRQRRNMQLQKKAQGLRQIKEMLQSK